MLLYLKLYPYKCHNNVLTQGIEAYAIHFLHENITNQLPSH